MSDLEEKLKDLMLNIDDPSEELVFAKGFGCITDIEFIDIRDNYMSLDLIQNWLDRHGDGVLVNRKSTTWRNLSDEDRQTPTSTLLQAHPTLIKRPIIVVGGHSFVGWNVDVKSALGVA